MRLNNNKKSGCGNGDGGSSSADCGAGDAGCCGGTGCCDETRLQMSPNIAAVSGVATTHSDGRGNSAGGWAVNERLLRLQIHAATKDATPNVHVDAKTHAKAQAKRKTNVSRQRPEARLQLVVIEPERLFRDALQHMVMSYAALQWVAGFDTATTVLDILRVPHGVTELFSETFPSTASTIPVVVLSTHIHDIPLVACIRQLKRIDRRMKVLVLADEENGFLAHHYRDAGADGYIAKTTTERQCIRALCALQQKRWVFTHTGHEVLTKPHPQPPSAEKLSREQPDVDKPHTEEQAMLRLSQSKIAGFHALSQREREVFLGLLQGKTSRAIAKEYCLSHKTIWTHKHNVFKKLNITSLRELFLLGTSLGWGPPKLSLMDETML